MTFPAFKPKHFWVWTVICAFAAGPSFFLGLGVEANPFAMLLGVACFIVAYTVATSSPFYDSLKQRPTLYKCFKFGFGFRILQTALPLLIGLLLSLGMHDLEMLFAYMLFTGDMFSGAFALGFVQWLLGLPVEGDFLQFSKLPYGTAFLASFITTLIQGVFLNLLVLAVVILAYLSVKPWMLLKRRMSS